MNEDVRVGFYLHALNRVNFNVFMKLQEIQRAIMVGRYIHVYSNLIFFTAVIFM